MSVASSLRRYAASRFLNVHASPKSFRNRSAVAIRLQHVAPPPLNSSNGKAACTPALKPGISDDTYFPPNENILFWRHFVTPQRPTETAARLRRHVDHVFYTSRKNPSSILYWLHAFARLAFFNNVFSSLGHTFLAMRLYDAPLSTRLLAFPINHADELLHVFKQDYDNIRTGTYNMPWDVSLTHRQSSPFFILRQILALAAEAPRVLSKTVEKESSNSNWLHSKLFPHYYSQTFHHQTDGWLSSSSADVYEVSTESLFRGTQDAMQRTVLKAISLFVQSYHRNQSKLTMLDLGAGTGRFSTFVRDNWPHAHYILADLSPFYLQKARENMSYWQRKRASSHLGPGSVRFMQANAEDLPLEKGSVDILYAVYLFHELPPHARQKVVLEAARILRPGGLFIIADSVQFGDRLHRDSALGNFERLNEPWFSSFIELDLGKLVCKDGMFTPYVKEVASMTKMLSFRRLGV
ncbi:putative methyltransferase sll0829 [Gracilariopsis chorda]|uniref:Putative methyltransferase sll0829 n=1 Tax=Gracilariopsis chorda TaxID=448386 RepID=A0A2V3IM86_9FLOR|nr:putative methyltransferase sll0829 [Gracilariopsis chorda]|eukprot:PXF43194.1 putative methyltransferase sll0829 [Gracilariopsis chorda]